MKGSIAMKDKVSFINNTINDYTGHVIFIILGILSIYFYTERIINTDAANYAFHLLNYEEFCIAHKRYGAFISQLIPLLAIKLGISVDNFLLLYSVSFIILFYSIYLLCVYILKNKVAGIAIILTLLIGVSHSFYRPVSESIQGLLYSIVLYAFLNFKLKIRNTKISGIVQLLISLLLVLLCSVTHPFTIFSVLFVIIFTLIDKKQWNNYILWTLVLFAAIMYSYKYVTINSGSYEGNILDNLSFSVLTNDFFNFYSTKFFLKRIYSFYLATTLLFAGCIVLYGFQKKILKLILVIGFVTGYFIINNIIYKSGDSDIQMEKTFMPLTIFCVIPLFKNFSGKKAFETIKTFIFLVIIVSSFYFILRNKVYVNRLNYMNKIANGVRCTDSQKFFVYSSDLDRRRLMYSWTFSMETIFQSTYNKFESLKTIYIFQDEIPEHVDLKRKDLFLFVPYYLCLNVNDLNKKYFDLPQEEYTWYWLGEKIIMDMETITNDSAQLTCKQYPHLRFGKTEYIDSVYYHSANKSLRSTRMNEEIVHLELPLLDKNTELEVSTYFLGTDSIDLYIKSDNEIIKTRSQITETNPDGWKKITTILKISNRNRQYTIGLKNLYNDTVYIDDFEVWKKSVIK